MSDAKHTPGPWKLSPEPDANVFDPISQQGIAYTVAPGAPYIESGKIREANARLMSAAPELLDALVTLLGFADSGDPGSYDYDGMIKAATAAVKKARGFA